MRLPARDIPPPTTISNQARLALSEGALGPAPEWPPAHDLEAWRAAIGESTALWEEVAAGVLAASPSPVETRAIGGSDLPPGDAARAWTRWLADRSNLFINGGAFGIGGGP